MDLDLLPTFSVFAEALNFTRAAAKLHLSQPAVHMQVKKLEGELGVPLYRRIGRRLELTREGGELARFARETGERTRAFLSSMQGEVTSEPVVLAAGEGAYLYLLGPAIASFRAREQAPLRLLMRDRDGTIDAVRTGVAHLGIAALDFAPEGLSAHRLTTVPPVVVLPKSHRLARKRVVRPRDLGGERLVVPPVDRPQRATIARALVGVPFEIGVEAIGWEVTIHFVALGFGLAIVNGFCRVPRGLVTRPIREVPSIDYWLLSPRGTRPNASIVALREDLLANGDRWRVRA